MEAPALKRVEMGGTFAPLHYIIITVMVTVPSSLAHLALRNIMTMDIDDTLERAVTFMHR